jgi:hypothetical protein
MTATSNLMKQLSLNINQPVWVKLTPLGRKIYKDYWAELLSTGGYVRDLKPPKLRTKNGYTEFQLWDLMHIYGGHLYLGGENPFSLTVRFDANDFDSV